MQCQSCLSYQTIACAAKHSNPVSEVVFTPSQMQSEETALATDDASASEVVAENIMFKDEALSQVLDLGSMANGDYDADSDSAAGLASFLSRPVRIANITWSESTATQTSILPWHLYFNTSQIKNKLQNFGKISCRLHLKFIVNASPFYYGSLRACWFPLGDQRGDYVNIVDQVPFSQVPGVFLEPQNMSSAEMILPFVWQRNWLEITTASDFQRMGVLQFLQYANLRSANGVAGSGITIGVYAWAEDVKLMGLTAIAAMQSKDEYVQKDGVISAPATAVAQVASKLTNAPVIGPFARATEIGANAVAGVAKLFGYSNPPVISDAQPFQNKSYHAFANVETRMPIDKLSIDPKNEVSISRSTMGLEDDGDELAFDRIFGKESFLQGTNWSNSQATDTLLWSALITPTYTLTGGGYTVTTPASYFMRMFRYWRGSLIYTFRFVATKYHKGRVIISYDPNGDISGNADTETTNFTRIVDLSVDQEVEIAIPYKSSLPWLETSYGSDYSNGATPTYTYKGGSHNGSITLRVQNKLTGPAVNPQIDVLVFVKAGPDFQAAVPTNLPLNQTVYDPAGVIQSEDISLSKTSLDSQIAAITVGENIASLRPLLHRTVLVDQLPVSDSAFSASVWQFSQGLWRIPIGPGRTPQGYTNAKINGGNVYPSSTSRNTAINWIGNCFVGFRGSTNVHLNYVKKDLGLVDDLRLERLFATPLYSSGTSWQRNISFSYFTFKAGTAFQGMVDAYNLNPSTGLQGLSLTNMNTQSALSVNAPQYTPLRFLQSFEPKRTIDAKTAAPIYDELTFRYTLRIPTTQVSDSTIIPHFDVYYSAGVDFQPLMFLCTPRMFTNAMSN